LAANVCPCASECGQCSLSFCSSRLAAAPNIEIRGDASEAVNKLAMQAIADPQDYWGKEFPELYDKDCEPVKG
jgi:hypothetical protein